MHEKPYRFEVFEDISEQIPDKEYWELLGEIWTNTENMWQNTTRISRLMSSQRLHRQCIMNAEERAYYNKMPQQIEVYRGHQTVNRIGYSWTTNEEKAKFFAHRWGKKGTVTRGIANKTDVIAVFLRRSEFEIAINPFNVKVQLQKRKI